MSERRKLYEVTRVMKGHPNIFWYKIPDGPTGGRRPCDVVACVDGRFIGIEFKEAGQLLAPHQLEILSRITAAGGIATPAHFVPGGIMIGGVVVSIEEFPEYLRYLARGGGE